MECGLCLRATELGTADATGSFWYVLDWEGSSARAYPLTSVFRCKFGRSKRGIKCFQHTIRGYVTTLETHRYPLEKILWHPEMAWALFVKSEDWRDNLQGDRCCAMRTNG